MTNNQTNKENMFDATYQVMQTNISTWTANPAITTVVNKLGINIINISTTSATQAIVSTGVTNTKDVTKTILINNILANASAGLAYAVSISNLTLKAKCQITKRDLLNTKESELSGIAQNLHDALNPFAAALPNFGASTTTLATLQTSISNYTPLVGTPRSARTPSISSTLTLPQQFTSTMQLLEDQLDPLMEQYKTTNTLFYNSYHVARKIINVGHRTTVILMGFIYNNHGVALAHAIVTIVGNKHHKKITTADGHYKFTRLVAGTYTIQVVATGFITQTQTITAATPQTIKNNFTMVAIGTTPAPTGGTTIGTTPPATA